jgi:hypothetical protein
MTAADTCVRCGENPSVPGRFGLRCDECLTELFGKPDGHPDDAVVLTLEYPDGRARRYVIDDAGDGTHSFAEFVRTEGGTWRPVGEESLAGVELRVPDGD